MGQSMFDKAREYIEEMAEVEVGEKEWFEGFITGLNFCDEITVEELDNLHEFLHTIYSK